MKSKIIILQAILLAFIFSCTKETAQYNNIITTIQPRSNYGIKVKILKSDNTVFVSDVLKIKVYHNNQSYFDAVIFSTLTDSLVLLGKELSAFHLDQSLKVTSYSNNIATIFEPLGEMECVEIDETGLLLNIGTQNFINSVYFIVEETDGF